MPIFVPSYPDNLYMHMFVACICVMGVCMSMGVVCIYTLKCVGICMHLYVDEGILQMFLCGQNTSLLTVCILLFTYNPTIFFQDYIM